MGVSCSEKKVKKNPKSIEDKFENIKNNNISKKIINKLEDKFINIKSKYVLQKIFNNLKDKKSLETVKYNKKIKKNLDININNYKEYCEKYSSIEIVIKMVNNFFCGFINNDKEYKEYYHIFLNNNKEEIKNEDINEKERV